MKRISVVIPALDAAGSIGATISSLRSEADLIREIVVIDDGCSDDTVPVAEAIGRELDLPVRVVWAGQRDVGAARNAGYEDTTAPWLYFLDADDLHLEGGLRRLLDEADANPRADLIVGAYVRRASGADRLVHPSEGYFVCRRETAGEFLADRLEPINIGVALIARSIMAGTRFPERVPYEEDTLFWAQLLKTAVVARVDAAVMIYNLSLRRADDRLVSAAALGFFAWRRALERLSALGIQERVLRGRAGLMAIKLARVHYLRGDLRSAARFLRLARSAPKDLTGTWRYWRYRLKVWKKGLAKVQRDTPRQLAPTFLRQDRADLPG